VGFQNFNANRKTSKVLARTKPSGENVYTVISAPESATPPETLLDSESSSIPTDKLQKEAEMFFSGISPGLPQQAIGGAAGPIVARRPALQMFFLLGLKF
jgi:hypothetical protein